MTEEEARARWCPQAANTKSFVVMSAILPALTSNTATVAAVLEETLKDLGDVEKCIASDCMAWKSNEYRDENGVHVEHKVLGHCGLVK